MSCRFRILLLLVMVCSLDGVVALGTAIPDALAAAGKLEKKAKKEKKEKKKQPEFFYEYTVQKGDSLSLIASRYDVSVKKLLRWNPKLGKDARKLAVGTVLKVYSNVPVRPKRLNYYVVKKGDNLKRLSKRLSVTVSQLKDLNSIKGSIIRPGQKLAYLVPGPETPSESVGKASSGKLVNGEKMPAGPGYSYGSRPNVYATNETITLLIQCFGQYRKKFTDGPDLVVGNMSRETGGKLDPHKSHQSGRDVDLGYIHKQKFQPVTRMLATDEDNLDPEKTWFLLKCFLDTKKVKVMFIDYKIQKLLYEYLVKHKYKKGYLDGIFQYPKGKGTDAVIKHLQSHHHHVHIRFLCPEKDARCEE